MTKNYEQNFQLISRLVHLEILTNLIGYFFFANMNNSNKIFCREINSMIIYQI